MLFFQYSKFKNQSNHQLKINQPNHQSENQSTKKVKLNSRVSFTIFVSNYNLHELLLVLASIKA